MGTAAARAAPTSAQNNNFAQSHGNTSIGRRQPKAATLTIANSTQASPSPTGNARNAVSTASPSARHISSTARLWRVSPSAQTGANWGKRIPAIVVSEAHSANPATLKVSTFKARVIRNVCSNTPKENAFTSSWVMTLLDGKPKSRTIRSRRVAGALVLMAKRSGLIVG